MTLTELFNYVDEIKPNAFSNETKTVWLNEIEGKVQTEVFLRPIAECIAYVWNDDATETLLVRPPHSKLYGEYICARIDYANGEYDKYANSMQMFNEFWSEFMRWYAQNYRPADVGFETAWNAYFEIEEDGE